MLFFILSATGLPCVIQQAVAERMEIPEIFLKHFKYNVRDMFNLYHLPVYLNLSMNALRQFGFVCANEISNRSIWKQQGWNFRTQFQTPMHLTLNLNNFLKSH